MSHTKNRSKPFNALAMILGLSLMGPLSATAGNIIFNDLSEGGITVTDTTGRGSVSCLTLEVCIVTLLPPLDPAGGFARQGTTGPGSTNIFEPGSGVLSDTMLLGNNALGNLTITFRSDAEGTPLTLLAGGRSVFETGGLDFVATVGWIFADNTQVNDQIGFISDITAVPEPETLAMIGLSLGSLALSRRRSSRARDMNSRCFEGGSA